MSKVTYWAQYRLWKQNLLLLNLGKISKNIILKISIFAKFNSKRKIPDWSSFWINKVVWIILSNSNRRSVTKYI